MHIRPSSHTRTTSDPRRNHVTRLAFRVLAPVVLIAGLLLPQAPVHAQSENVTLLGHRDAYGFHSGIWGYSAPNGVELAIIGTDNGVSFVNVTDPSNPTEVAFFTHPNTIWTEIRTFGHYAYWSNDSAANGLGIVDLSNPLSPQFVRFHTAFTTCHSLHIDTQLGWLYCNGCSSNRTFILDVGANPTNPPTIAIFNDYYVHDSYSRDGIAYFAAISDGALGIEDFTSPPSFFNQSFTQYPGGATHNCWLTDDSNYLLTTDETGGGHLRVWDVQDLTNPQQVSEYALPGDASIIHNVYVKGNLAIASWYTAGLQILDITDPFNPQRVGYYDTYPGTAGYDGAWGVYPYANNGNIYISDMATGLYIFRFTPNYGTVNGTVTQQGSGTPLAGVSVSVEAQGANSTTNASGQYSLNLPPGTHTVEYSKFGYGSTTRMVNITLGQTTVQNVPLTLLPTGAITGIVRSQLGAPLFQANIALLETPLSAISGINGAYSLTGVPTGSYLAEASLFGYGNQSVLVDVVASQTTPRDFTLQQSVFADNAETNLGWSLGVAGDNANSGVWVRSDPVGTGGGGVQPEDDHTPAPGVTCFVTANCTPGCGVGDADVDGGKTTLMSPVFNLSGQTGAKLVYYRWYSNDAGGNPGQDIFQVDISSNNGTSWVNLESLIQTRNFWEKMTFDLASYITLTNQVKIRFIAQDTGGGSVVEAAIDDVEITLPPPTVAVEPVLPVTVRLFEATPNPMREGANLRFALAARQPVLLDIVDIQGRQVRSLISNVVEAGEHVVRWDGRDAEGRLVPAGMYLQRLATEKSKQSAKLLVVR
ncbi:MAG: choice-of-anchor B family protein [Candidatus Eisenbacteria bacterium]|nr:choice-of-anchor B family protein [Candidatus Eisenbacteria bacterium]